MKSKLATLWNRKKRRAFTATFDRYGTRPSYRRDSPEPIPTLLLKLICLKTGTVNTRGNDGGLVQTSEVAKHVWVRDIKPFLHLIAHLEPGDKVSFSGRVDMFPKGSHRVDFHIVEIDKVKRMREPKAA